MATNLHTLNMMFETIQKTKESIDKLDCMSVLASEELLSKLKKIALAHADLEKQFDEEIMKLVSNLNDKNDGWSVRELRRCGLDKIPSFKQALSYARSMELLDSN